jgi:hypothetical protein
MEHDYAGQRKENYDVDVRLPSPMIHENSEESDNTNSSEEQNIVKRENEEVKIYPKISINEKAYLTHKEALKNVFDKELVHEDFLKNWNDDDIIGLIIQLTKHNVDEEGVKQISWHFKDTSTEEVFYYGNNKSMD